MCPKTQPSCPAVTGTIGTVLSTNQYTNLPDQFSVIPELNTLPWNTGINENFPSNNAPPAIPQDYSGGAGIPNYIPVPPSQSTLYEDEQIYSEAVAFTDCNVSGNCCQSSFIYNSLQDSRWSQTTPFQLRSKDVLTYTIRMGIVVNRRYNLQNQCAYVPPLPFGTGISITGWFSYNTPGQNKGNAYSRQNRPKIQLKFIPK